MIARVIAFSVRNRFLVLLLTAMLVAGGVWAALHLSLDAVPDLSDVQVIVTTGYAGQAPGVVEDPGHVSADDGPARHPARAEPSAA